MRAGFTLVEIMITVAIIAILAAIAVPNYVAYRDISHKNACNENKEMIKKACYLYEVRMGASVESLDALFSQTGSNAAFVKPIPHCPIQGEYSLERGNDGYTVTCSKDAEHAKVK